MKYNAIIIGCGSIGTSKDVVFDSKDTVPKTHANAICKNENINLVGVIDMDFEKAIEAAKKWDTKPYLYFTDIKESVDIIVISSATTSHYLLLSEIIKILEPLIIVCEKPFCDNLRNARDIYNQFYSNLIPISINYTRRYSNEIQAFRNDLKEGKFGNIYSAVFNYNRGLLRDAPHAIDICNWFFGEFRDGRILGNDSVWINDLSSEDPTVPIWMSYEKCPNIFMVPVDGRKAACFEMEIITEQGKIVLDDWFQGFKFYPVTQEDTYGNYASLSGTADIDGSIELTNCLPNMYDNVVSHLDNNEELKCTAEDAVQVHKVIEYLRNKR
jgi:predicted dehydrogenase